MNLLSCHSTLFNQPTQKTVSMGSSKDPFSNGRSVYAPDGVSIRMRRALTNELFYTIDEVGKYEWRFVASVE